MMAPRLMPQAAKWNFDRILDPEVNSWVRPYYEDIEAVEVVDKYTLRVRTKHPAGDLPIALAGYFQGIPMASPKSFETHGKDWVRHPSGTGPYKLKEWVPGTHVILEKNPDYFKKGLPYLDTLEFRIMKDPLAAATALRTGEIDLIVAAASPLSAYPGKESKTSPSLLARIWHQLWPFSTCGSNPLTTSRRGAPWEALGWIARKLPKSLSRDGRSPW